MVLTAEEFLRQFDKLAAEARKYESCTCGNSLPHPDDPQYRVGKSFKCEDCYYASTGPLVDKGVGAGHKSR